MNDLVVTRIDEPDQTVVVRVEENVVALEVFVQYPATQPDLVLLFDGAGAGRLGSAVILAATHAREAS
jgi:hypothetical protein